jgi:radical SAM/Cys-rich protein
MSGKFRTKISRASQVSLRRMALEILQVNVGDICNQQCHHCHVDAHPAGKKVMSRLTMEAVVRFLSQAKTPLTLDITGGCPELNPDFKFLVEAAYDYTRQIIVRNNLTIFLEPGMEDLPQFYSDNKVKLICSLPCYTRENVDAQRGDGVFDKSIQALQILNQAGFGLGNDLELDLVYNPGGAVLPGNQAALEQDYKKNLREQFGISFDQLLTITNSPINRFRQSLEATGALNEYLKLLEDSFNPNVAGQIMCRKLLNVGWDGSLYDCDFNQALGLGCKNSESHGLKVEEVKPADFEGQEIIFADHCFSCTAGEGSSCGGALVGMKE